MKNILMVIPNLRMAGAEKSLVSLIRSLDPKRVNVDVFLFETGGILQQQLPKWVNVIEENYVTRAMTLEMRLYFFDLIKSLKFGAAFSRFKITFDAFFHNKFGKKAKFSWRTVEKYISVLPKHYDVAVGYLEGYSDFFVIDKVQADKKIGWIHIDMTGKKILEEEIQYYNAFDELATISDVCLDAACKAFPGIENKIQIIENIVLPKDVRSRANENITDKWENTDVCHLVSVGRLEYQKGMDIAAKAAKVLVDRGCSFCWHIYGKGSMQPEIEQYIKENNLEAAFVLEGLRENPYPYIKNADIMVQPSRWEGKSIVLDEAKILGKAIVVTNYPSVYDQVTDKITGLITDITPEAIADGIEELIKNNELKEKLEYNCLNEPNQSEKAVNKFYKMIEA